MKLQRLQIAAIGLIMLLAVYGYGQHNSNISGTLTDSLTHGPIPFATVALLNQQTKSPVKEIQTDTVGHFVLANVPSGTFTLRVSYVGYNDISKQNILVNPTTGNVNLGTIAITPSNSNLLKEVAVTAKKNALQNIDGKKVFSVNQSLVSKGGSAADLLQNVPTLQIDANGNVSLRGSSGVKVLVDGKPSIIANGDITQILQSIPASSIESIEVIANPSAKYDANGEGIINIILNKNARPGLNGSADFGVGTWQNYNGDANLSYQSGKVNFYGNYSRKDGNTYSNGFQYMTFLQPTDSIVYSNETFPSITSNKIQFLKAGIDYALSPKSTLGVSGSFNSRNSHRDEVLTINNLAADGGAIQSSNRYNTIDKNGSGYEFDLDYTRHFKKPKEILTFNFSYAYSSGTNYQEYKTYFDSIKGETAPAIDTPLISDIRNNGTNYNIQVDYVLPVGKTGQFSAGYRSQITLGNNNQYAYNDLGTAKTPLYAFTSFFGSNSQVHAVYFDYQDKIANFSYEAGLRAEDSHLNATFTSYNANNVLLGTPVKVPVKGLYPSILLTEKLKNNGKLLFTFANRLSRPTAKELNSTTDFSDPVNYSIGNPALKPESITDLELGYNKTWPLISFTASIYYNNMKNVIKHIQTNPVGDITTTIPENLQRSVTTGLELIGHFNLLKGWDLTANANMYERDNSAAPQYGIAADHGISWNANVTTNITPIQRLSFQIRADYRAPDMIVQDNNRAAWGLDAAAKYDFASNRASLGFNTIDIFNTRRWAFLRSSNDLLLNFQRNSLSSRATLTFTYRFGSSSSASKQTVKKEPKQDKRIDDHN
jgi:outer membrane receptor protein involved in Fe transport